MKRQELANRLALLKTLMIRRDWEACRNWIDQWQAAEKTETNAEVLTGHGAGSPNDKKRTNR